VLDPAAAAAVRVAEEQCPDYAVANAHAPSSGSGTGAHHSGWVRLVVEASRSSWDAAVPTSSQTAFADRAVAAEDPQDQEPHLAAVVVVGRRGGHPSPQSSSESEACLVGAAAAEVVGHPCPGSCRRQRHSSSGH